MAQAKSPGFDFHWLLAFHFLCFWLIPGVGGLVGLGVTFTVGVTVTVVVVVTAPGGVISGLEKKKHKRNPRIVCLIQNNNSYCGHNDFSCLCILNYQLIVIIINSTFKHMFLDTSSCSSSDFNVVCYWLRILPWFRITTVTVVIMALTVSAY